MRNPLIIAALVVALASISTSGWELKVSPPTNQLHSLVTETDHYVVCDVVFGPEEDSSEVNTNVVWLKNGVEVPKQRRRLHRAAISFIKPTSADNGLYVCKATVDDKERKDSVDIVFHDRAGFVNIASTQHPEDGSDAQIVCNVKGDSLAEIYWQKDGTLLTVADERGYSFENDSQTLVIPKFNSVSDDGTYTCHVVQFAHIYHTDINVVGFSKPFISVFEFPEDNYGFEDATATFKCQATGKPTPTYTWVKNEADGKVVKLEGSDKYKIDDGLLGINYLSVSDAGDYSCEATNSIGADVRVAKLNVHLKPKIVKIPDVSTLVGQSVEIRCPITSDTEVLDAYFTFNGQRYEPEVILTTTVAPESESSEEETEVYVESHTFATVRAELEDDTESEHLQDPEVTNLSMEQELEETSTSEYIRRRRSITQENVVVEWQDSTLVLTITNVTMENKGRYICNAQNLAGTTHEGSRLRINHKPVFTNHSQPLLRRSQGEEATIVCEVDSDPAAEIEITQNGRIFDADGVNAVVEKEENGIVVAFKNLTEGDFGTFECTARNTEGDATPVVVELVEILPVRLPTSIVCTDQIYPNSATCKMQGYDDEPGSLPTLFRVYYLESIDQPAEDFDWEHANEIRDRRMNTDRTVLINDLKPRSNYFARFRPVNELGDGPLSEVFQFETTVPWTPMSPNVTFSCPDVCVVDWEEPNDRGSPVTEYRIIIEEVSAACEDCEGEATVTPSDTILVGPRTHHVDLPQLLPLRTYQLSLYAVNDVGNSEPTVFTLQTTEQSGLANLFTPIDIIGLVILIALLLLVIFIADFFCYKFRGCGVRATIQRCCCGHTRRAKDIEQGANGAESHVLLGGTTIRSDRNQDL